MSSAAESQAAPSLDALYRAHVGAARRLAVLLTGDPTLAEDLAHDAFVRVAAKLETLRDAGAFEVYLKRSVVNAVRSHARHQRVVRNHEHRFEPRDAPDAGPDVALRDALWAALQWLPRAPADRDRAALLRRRVRAGHRRRDALRARDCEVTGVARTRATS